MLKHVSIYFLALLFMACGSSQSTAPAESEASTEIPARPWAKFEPADGEVILFVGQDLASIGGVEGYNDGYFDNFDTPGGFTMYTNFCPGDMSFGHQYKGLDGVKTTDDWGDAPSNMDMQMADENFDNSALAIGLAFVNHDAQVANGEHDDLILELGEWIKALGNRPVFLRIGYEFSGSWNHYDRENYLKAFKRIRNMYDSIGVTNVAYVWQSHGADENMEHLESWYPGDEYVDWCSFSFFNRWREQAMVEFAKKHQKPVFIAEATPTITHETSTVGGKTKETILGKLEQGQEAWEKWFVPFFSLIHENPESIKAISYINCFWLDRPMWVDNPTFQDIDARLQTSKYVSDKWVQEISDPRYLHASEDLFDRLWNNQE